MNSTDSICYIHEELSIYLQWYTKDSRNIITRRQPIWTIFYCISRPFETTMSCFPLSYFSDMGLAMTGILFYVVCRIAAVIFISIRLCFVQWKAINSPFRPLPVYSHCWCTRAVTWLISYTAGRSHSISDLVMDSKLKHSDPTQASPCDWHPCLRKKLKHVINIIQ